MTNHPMTFGDFQAEAARTGGTDLHPDRQMQGLVTAALGLAGETAEVLSIVLYPNAYRHEIAEEIGDVLWCAAHLCNVLGWRFSGITAPDTTSVAPACRRWDTIRDFHEDHSLARRSSSNEVIPDAARVYATRLVLGAGKIADAVKKAACHGQPLDNHLPTINLEINSLMVNLVLVCEASGARLDGAARLNVEKMRNRYPDGFTTEASDARRDEPTAAVTAAPQVIGKVRIHDPRYARPWTAEVVCVIPTLIVVQNGEKFDREHGKGIRNPARRIDADDLAAINKAYADVAARGL